MELCFEALQEDNTPSSGPQDLRARTGRRWLNKLGLKYSTYRKGVYFDGHEREDVVNYRQEHFLPRWKRYRERFVVFQEDGSFSAKQDLSSGQKPLVLVTHDESTFNANDGQKAGWVDMVGGRKDPLKPKGRGKGIMVSAFLTPIGILKIPDNVTDEMLGSQWPKDNSGRHIREACLLLEYGKDNYWTSEKLLEQIRIASMIFKVAFPHYQALFAFDNATNHCAYAADALVASKINLHPGGQQPKMRDGFDYSHSRKQSMVFPADYSDESLRNQPKGMKRVLEERELWRDTLEDGTKFLLKCKTPGCPTDGPLFRRCCAMTVLSNQPDFQQQKGRVAEDIERSGHLVIFYPKFHCELNFIERFWCSSKRYARDNCTYSLPGLRGIIPRALRSVPTSTIYRYYMHCEKIIDAYLSGYRYGTAQFTEKIRNQHRSVTDTTKY